MRVACSLEILPERLDWRSRPTPLPAQLALMDDEGGVMATIDLKDLAAALAPFLTTHIGTKE